MNLQPTYCFKLFHLMVRRNEDVEVIRSNYTAKGLEGIIKDTFDDQLYKVTIEPYTEDKNGKS